MASSDPNSLTARARRRVFGWLGDRAYDLARWLWSIAFHGIPFSRQG